MLCDHCHNEEAIVHIRGLDQSGNVRSLSLCAACALQEIMMGTEQADELLATFREAALLNPDDIMKILQAAMGGKHPALPPELVEAQKECCPGCGQSRADFHRTHLLGCGKCLEFLKQDICDHLGSKELNFFDTLHSLDSTSRKYTAKVIPQESIRNLNARISTAVAAEQYEQASLLKEQLDDMLAQLSGKSDPVPRKGWGSMVVRDEFALPEQTVANLPWLPKKKTGGPLVQLASFVSLNRNLQIYELPPFGKNLSQSEELCQLLSPLLSAEPLLGSPSEFDPHKMSKKERLELLERTLCPPDFLFRNHSCRLFLSRNERVTCLLNNIDHLSLHAWGSPQDLPLMFHQFGQFHERLSNKISFLDDLKIGYVTRNIFQCGSGMKFGLLLHLPCLIFMDRLPGITNACSDLGFLLRPLHRNGRNVLGGVVILETANGQCVPGDKIAPLLSLAEKINEHELSSRDQVRQDFSQRALLTDMIGRAVGNLRGMRLLEQNEAQHLLSMLWLGCELEMLPWLSLGQIMQKITELAAVPAIMYGQENDSERKLQMQYFLARRFRHDLAGLRDED